MVAIIDGMDGLEATLHFAGVAGVDPMQWTLAEVWAMAEGSLASKRRLATEQAMLVWSLGEIDAERYLHYGDLASSPKGQPVKLSDELEAKVQEEIKRIRREENPPEVRVGNG